MTAFLIGVGVSIITGALVNEFCDISPWLAQRLARNAARLWALGDPELKAVYEEEWAAVVQACPGKVTKLVVAARFAAGAVARTQTPRLRKVAASLLLPPLALLRRRRARREFRQIERMMKAALDRQANQRQQRLEELLRSVYDARRSRNTRVDFFWPRADIRIVPEDHGFCRGPSG